MSDSRPRFTNRSGYTGIHWGGRDDQWVVTVTHGGRQAYIGVHPRLGTAVRMRDAARVNLKAGVSLAEARIRARRFATLLEFDPTCALCESGDEPGHEH